MAAVGEPKQPHTALTIIPLNVSSSKSVGSPGIGGMTIVVKDLTFSVVSNTNKAERIKLLSNVSGFFLPGQMAALMGPSGSGKTTLLDILAGRKTSGQTTGEVLFAGHKPTIPFLRRYTGYVEQFDTLLPILTVEEMLMYTAELKRPMKESKETKRAAVEELLQVLALDTCRNVKIGSNLSKGISGGQAKRTNIGIALITNPRVLFLDEPTSGLDSYTSNEVMSVVKKLVANGTTIVATIHSPTSYAFNLFDKLMMLTRGELIYFGEQGAPAIEYVRNISGCAQIKEQTAGYNDAEWLVDLVTEADRKGQASVLAAAFAKSDIKKQNDLLIDQILETKTEVDAATQKELNTKNATVTPWWYGLKTLVKYRTLRNYKDPAFLGPRLGDKVIMGFLLLTLYLGIGNDFSQTNIPNIAAILFMFVTLPAYGASSYVPAIVLERGLFVRERNDGLYRVITYLLSKLIDELMLAMLGSLGFSLAVFYGVRFTGNFGLFWLVNYCTLSIGIVLAYFIAAASPNMDVANALLPTYVTVLLFFGGFFLRFTNVPRYWKWATYINFLRFSFTAVAVNEFKDNNVPYINGQTVLEYYSLDEINEWAALGYLFIFFIVFTTLAWATLRYKKYSSR